jgi:bisphosphoglycerate-independent phosphoglycerate mutase (AlkP superfamily)
VTTCAVEAAKMSFRKLPDLLGRSAVFHDFSNQSLIDLQFEVPLFSPVEAALILAKLTDINRFTLYEYFITDKIGHAQNFEAAQIYLPPLADFVRETVRAVDLQTTTVILTSDHGNVEDLSIRTHTLNDVPTVIWGRKNKETASSIKDLSDIAPAILNLLSD